MDETGALDFSVMSNPTIVYRSPRQGALLSVTEVGRQTVRSLIVGRRLTLFAGVLVEDGRGTLDTAPSGRVSCKAPALFWLCPGIPHTYGPVPGTSWDERWALFDGSLAAEFLSRGLIDPAAPAISLSARSEVPPLFRDLHGELTMRSPLGDSAAAATLGRIATRAAIEAERSVHLVRRDIDMIAALRERAFSAVDMEAFAGEFGLSASTLRRRFIAATGLPPKALQLRVRIDRAKELLATTSRSIEQVAVDVGFDDAFYFARLFLKRENMSPSEFRRRNHRE